MISDTLVGTMVQNPELPDEASGGAADAAPSITSRFLFVDVAAQRAKQLRRGALPRLERVSTGPAPHKLERLAMEEVRAGLISYTLPDNFEGAGRVDGA